MRVREVVSITGATGTGKSTKLRELLRQHRRVMVIDPVLDDTWERDGYERVGGLQDMSRVMAQGWRAGFKCVLTPDDGEVALHAASKLMFAYSLKLGKQQLALAVDEMTECYSTAHAMRAKSQGFKEAILQGRHINLSIYGATQRPQDVATRFRDNALHAFFFALHDDSARQAVLRKIGREHAKTFLGLQDFQYLEWNRGRVTVGKTRGG